MQTSTEKSNMNTLRETFLNELADIYDAERQLLKALPKMAKAAQHEDLKAGLESHLTETQTHVQRIEQAFEALGEKPKAKKCKAMKGLIEEGDEIISERQGDAALICGAQKVEHYEIATYGSLKAWAEILGETDAAELIEETLEEEKAADEKLTEIAEETINAEESEEAHADTRR
jgi:ferritin-like metal-binding protein YciE